MIRRAHAFLTASLTACALMFAPARALDVDRDSLRNEAFENAQRAMSGATANALAQLGARFAAGDGALAQAVRKRQDLLEAIRLADRRVVQSLAAAGADASQARARVDALRGELGATEEALARDFPEYADLASPRPISLDATRALLGEDEALVAVLSTNAETFVFGVAREDVRVARAKVAREELGARIRALRLGLDPAAPGVVTRGPFGRTVIESAGAPQTKRVAFDRKSAHAIWRDILAPMEPLLTGKTRVFFVLEAPLDSLPVSLLVTMPPEGEDDDPGALRATAWLVKRWSPVVLPSITSLRTLRGPRTPQARAPEPFRGYGAPLFSGDGRLEIAALRNAGTPASVFRGGKVDLDAVRSLAPLPRTAGELASLADALGAPRDAIRLGAAASVAAVKADDLSRYRVLAFATHGLLAGELAGLAEPALAFTPPAVASEEDNGLLTASEAATLRLNADWVILSACNTAAGDGTPGADGLSGLARAFFHAGARSLLVSHWPVRDDAAARITTATFKSLAADPNLGKADAVRRAVLALVDDASDPAFSHPAIWAPFVVVGEGR